MTKTPKTQPMPYLKLWLSYMDDIQFLKLPRGARLRYFELNMLAWRANSSRLLDPETGEPLSAAEIALLLRDSEPAVQKDMAWLQKARLVEQSDGAWYLPRFESEQIDWKEYRQAAAERAARYRSRENAGSEEKLIEDKQDESKTEDKEQTQIISEIKSSEVKVKRNNDVTRDTPTEKEEEAEEQTDAEGGVRSELLNNVSVPNLNSTAPNEIHPGLHNLAVYWKECTGEHISRFSQRLINIRLYEGVSPDVIHEKIQKLGLYEPRNWDTYFAECMKPERPSASMVEMISFAQQPLNLEQLLHALRRNNIAQPTREQLVAWGYIRE